MITTPNIDASVIYNEYYKDPAAGEVDIAQMGDLYRITGIGNELGFDDFIGKNVVKLFFDSVFQTNDDPGRTWQEDIAYFQTNGIVSPGTIDVSVRIEGLIQVPSTAAIGDDINVTVSYSKDGGGSWQLMGSYSATPGVTNNIDSEWEIQSIDSTISPGDLMIKAYWFISGNGGTGNVDIYFPYAPGTDITILSSPVGWLLWSPPGETSFNTSWMGNPIIE